jgi:hypothetical protein
MMRFWTSSKPWVRILAVILLGLFTSILCLFFAWAATPYAINSFRNQPPAAAAPGSYVAPTEAARQGGGGWVGDNFGPEQALPGTIIGPAIAELYNRQTGYCVLVAISHGEILVWKWSGAFWRALPSEGDPTGQKALEARYPHHGPEYLIKFPNCDVLQIGELNKVEGSSASTVAITEPETAPANTPTPIPTPTPTPKVEPPPAPAGTSCQLPCEVIGPAIVEYDGGIAKVDSSQSFNFTMTGTAWGFANQAALDKRWPEHLAIYQENCPTCTVGLP